MLKRLFRKKEKRLVVEHVQGSLPTGNGKGWIKTGEGDYYRAVDPKDDNRLMNQLRRDGKV